MLDTFLLRCFRYFSSCIMVFLACSSMAFALSPRGQWMSHHTPHFEIVYPEGQDLIAAKYALHAEMAYELLIPIFKEAPAKTVVVVDASSDLANGSAHFLPYPHIFVHPTLPDNLQSIDHYDHWSRGLIIHEYAHILTVEPAHGFYSLLQSIMGNIIRPNIFLPGWFHEGLAVEMETRFTKHGRLRSPQTSAALRALVAGNRLFGESIDRIGESPPTWPFGNRRYLMGSWLWKYMVDKGGVESISDLLQRYSRRLPYLLNTPARDIFGNNYTHLLNEFYAQAELRAQTQISKIQSQGQPKDRMIPLDGITQHSPAVSPTGSHFTVVNFHRYRGSELLVLDSQEKLIDKIGGPGFRKVSWASDGKFFIYDKLDIFDRHYTFYDLYRYDLKNRKSQRLTRGERAHEPTLAPDGQSIVYIKTKPGSTGLYQLYLADNSVHQLYQPELQIRLSRPEFINEDEVLFSERDIHGKEKFYVYSLKFHTTRALLKQFESVGHPRRTKNGVLFSSSRSGIHNLYLSDFDDLNQAYPITNTTTEIINGDLDSLRNQIYLTKLTPWGRKVFVQSELKETNPPKVVPLIGDSNKGAEEVKSLEVKMEPRSPTSSGKRVGSFRLSEMKTRPYNSLPYLFPRYWVPIFYQNQKSVVFRGFTSAFDPIRKHRYFADISFDTSTKKVDGGFNYTYSTHSASIGATYFINHESLLEGRQLLSKSSIDVTGKFYIPGLNYRWRGLASGEFIKTESRPSRQATDRWGSSIGIAYSGLFRPGRSTSYPGGYGWSLKHTEYFFKKLDKTNYYRTAGTFVYNGSHFLPDSQTLLIRSQVVVAHKLTDSLLGDSTVSDSSHFMGASSMGPSHLMNSYLFSPLMNSSSLINHSLMARGYPPGNFRGRGIVNFNVEYDFPILDIFRGQGVLPIFFRQIRNTFFVDYVGVEGLVGDKSTQTFKKVTLNRKFWGVGTELRLSQTIGYHLPIYFVLGLYYGLDKEAYGSYTSFIGIGLPFNSWHMPRE